MLLDFAKMHGLGNDFMVLDLVTQHCDVSAEQARIWADRRTGVGFDQLLLIEPPTEPEGRGWIARDKHEPPPDAANPSGLAHHDGSEVQQCGNGARCVAAYVARRQLSPKPELTLQTAGGPIVTRLQSPAGGAAEGPAEVSVEVSVEVDMGAPRTAAAALPFDPSGAAATDAEATYTVDVDGTPWRFTTVSMGNPHAVIMVDSVATAPVAEIGAALVGHPVFPEGANIGFCEVVDRGFLRLRVFERLRHRGLRRRGGGAPARPGGRAGEGIAARRQGAHCLAGPRGHR